MSSSAQSLLSPIERASAVMPITVPCVSISAMCARVLSLSALSYTDPHIIAFLMGEGSLSSRPASFASSAAFPEMRS